MNRSNEADSLLDELNISELVALGEAQGLGILNRVSPRARLINIVAGELTPEVEDMCPSLKQRATLQRFIEKNFEILRGQVPVCEGQCTTFGCPIGVALDHYDENRHYVD